MPITALATLSPAEFEALHRQEIRQFKRFAAIVTALMILVFSGLFYVAAQNDSRNTSGESFELLAIDHGGIHVVDYGLTRSDCEALRAYQSATPQSGVQWQCQQVENNA